MNRKQIEEKTCLRDFVTAAILSTGKTEMIGEEFRILEAGGREDLFELLKKEFPGAVVEQQKEGKTFEKESFDYIDAVGLKYLPDSEATDQLFREKTAYLKSGGIMAAHVCGYSGYYGAVMVGRIIRHLGSGKNSAGIVKIAQAVIRELPETHPAFTSEILKSRDDKAIKELLELSAAVDHGDKLYTVSKLSAAIPRWDGCFLQWVLPNLYELTTHFDSIEPAVLQRLNALPGPRRAIISELLTASPSDHYFLFQKL